MHRGPQMETVHLAGGIVVTSSLHQDAGAEGLIAGEWEEKEKGRKRRRHYQITAKGKEGSVAGEGAILDQHVSTP